MKRLFSSNNDGPPNSRSASGSSPPYRRIDSLVKYPGSKGRLMPAICNILPHHRHFISVFGGSGAEILGKPRSELETYNDLNGQLYNFFNVIKDGDVEELKRRVRAVPNCSQKIFADALAILQLPVTEPVESAWAFLVVGRQGNGTAAPPLLRPSSFGYACNPSSQRSKWHRIPDLIDIARHRFRRVQLFGEPYQRLFQRFNRKPTSASEVCWFLDPPYHPETLSAGSKLYSHEMTVEKHEELLDGVMKLHGYILLFNYDNELYRTKLKRWRRMVFHVKATMGLNSRSLREEVCWLNFNEDGKKLLTVRNGGAK